MRAARIDANQTEIVEALRACGYVVWIIGYPVDLLVGDGKRWCLMEVKDGAKPPSARKLTDIEAECVRRGGGPIAVVTDVEGALRAMMALDAGTRPCLGGDPLCPCQDGDSCHYRDTKKTKGFEL